MNPGRLAALLEAGRLVIRGDAKSPLEYGYEILASLHRAEPEAAYFVFADGSTKLGCTLSSLDLIGFDDEHRQAFFESVIKRWSTRPHWLSNRSEVVITRRGTLVPASSHFALQQLAAIRAVVGLAQWDHLGETMGLVLESIFRNMTQLLADQNQAWLKVTGLL